MAGPAQVCAKSCTVLASWLAHACIGWLRPDVTPGLSFLPGDIKYESPGGNVRVYFPIVLSVVLTLILRLFGLLLRTLIPLASANPRSIDQSRQCEPYAPVILRRCERRATGPSAVAGRPATRSALLGTLAIKLGRCVSRRGSLINPLAPRLSNGVSTVNYEIQMLAWRNQG
jgi:hypothetical protein